VALALHGYLSLAEEIDDTLDSVVVSLGASIGEWGDRQCVGHLRNLQVADEARVPLHLIELLLLVEDKRFWLHSGVDPIAIMRAAYLQTRNRGRLQGASTIPEQLLKSPMRRARVLGERGGRALRSCIAFPSDRFGTLLRYLDAVYLGRGTHGFARAATAYFQRPVLDLTAGQSFFLVERVALPSRVRGARIRNMLARRIVRDVVGSDLASLPEIYRTQFGEESGTIVQDVVRELKVKHGR